MDSEKIVLGALMLDNNLIHDMFDILKPECFANANHANVYRHIQQQYHEGAPFDLVSLTDRLGDKWTAPLGDLVSFAARYSDYMYHAKILHENRLRYELNIALHNAIKEISKRKAPKDIANAVNLALMAIEDRHETKIHLIGSTMDDFVNELEVRLDSDAPFVGLTSGFTDLDRSIQGFQSGNLVILAGRPAMGKSILAMNIAMHNARLNHNILFFSLEMTEYEIQQRLVASLSGVDYGLIQNAQCMTDSNSAVLVADAINQIKQSKFAIDDSSSLDIMDLRSRSVAYARKVGGVSMILVDYLQLVDAKGENRTQVVSTVSRELKRLAKDLQCTVIALSQLNRGLESRQDKRPNMGDLRESGQIEQDADKILFIYRDEVYNEHSRAQGLAEIIIGKARNCPRQDIVLTFQGKHQRFYDATIEGFNIVMDMKIKKIEKKSNFQDRYK